MINGTMRLEELLIKVVGFLRALQSNIFHIFWLICCLISM